MGENSKEVYNAFRKCLLQLTVLESYIAEKSKKLSEIEPQLEEEEKEKLAIIRRQL
jgi:hypothetical protein